MWWGGRKKSEGEIEIRPLASTQIEWVRARSRVRVYLSSEVVAKK